MLRSTMLALLAATTLLGTACGADISDRNILSAGGWPGINSDARNSNSTEVEGSRSLALDWSRPIGGTVATYTTIAANGQMFVTSNTEAGCNLFSFQMGNGRKRFCNRLNPGVSASTPVVDGATNIYVGDAGGMNSFNEHGQPRWRTPVVGTPISAQFTPDGNVLFVTHLGEIDVVAKQTGKRVTAPFQLVGQPDFLAEPNTPVRSDGEGLSDCVTGGPACPVANTPAIDMKTGQFYVTLWRPGAKSASLVALQYIDGDNPRIEPKWSADMLDSGTGASPVLSEDGSTVYVSDNIGRMIAVDSTNGKTKWVHDLGYAPWGSPAIVDGLIVPAGGENGHLLALRDAGDRAEVAWEDRDLNQLGAPAQAKGSTGYTVVRSGSDDLALVTFDTQTGETVASDVLPDARGVTSGTSIGPKGEVLTSSYIGELFVFK
ncbi:PQQ-binding-like beta-propeller repeat protein [Aldersonia kunmingensis]|uniref:outer membrane protein assembly factor BamB family protein n=1 Tax=Aldersonia kunmingensis TaxID=408066 RepID=UPI000834ECE9|nr:PQQ-binding-like beta-propeller repeat protein [Aldersonia kunmingensis]